MKDTERDALEHLVDICRDGERGFRTAAAAVADPQLKALFTELAEQRARFAVGLLPYLQRSETTRNEGSNVGALHRGWIHLKAHTPGHDDHSIAIETKRGETTALNAYEDALLGRLPPAVLWLADAQREAVCKTIDRLRAIDKGR